VDNRISFCVQSSAEDLENLGTLLVLQVATDVIMIFTQLAN